MDTRKKIIVKTFLLLFSSVLFFLTFIGSAFAISISDVITVYGQDKSENVNCLGKPLPTEEFRVGEESRFVPPNNLYYCCQNVKLKNPSTFSWSYNTSRILPYINAGEVRIYHKETKQETINGGAKNITKDYTVWVDGINLISLNPSESYDILVCSEKSNILEKKKWGLIFNFLGTTYDKDPYYNPASTNAFHPNTTRVPTFTGQDEFSQILNNDTLAMSATYNDYCSSNDCVANDNIGEVFRVDNSLTGNNGTVLNAPGSTFTQGVFGGSNGGIVTSNTSGIYNFTQSVNTNLSGLNSFGYGFWLNSTTSSPTSPVYLVSNNTGNNRFTDQWSYDSIGGGGANGMACDYRNSTGSSINAQRNGVTYADANWHFIYCNKNTTHWCVYIDNVAPSCTAATGAHADMNGANWSINFGYGLTNVEGVLDEIQFRKESLNTANITQLYYDGLHRLQPNNYANNNSLCEWYIQNSTGRFNVKNQTLGFNITTCTLNSTDTTQFKAGNNISMNFTPVNYFEAGLAVQNTTVISIINQSFINITHNGIFTYRTEFDVIQGQIIPLCKNTVIPNCTIRICYPN